MAKFFVFSEFTKSDTAKKLDIDNTPNSEESENIIYMMRMMDKIRERWTVYCEENYLQNPQIIVTSGFRCEELNKAVKGAKTSQHRVGSAVDFEAKNRQNKALFEVILDMIEDGEIICSQLIWEKGNEDNPDWLHIGKYEGNKKNEILKYEEGKGYSKYIS